MINKYLNLCNRCGKERIEDRIWQEKTGYSTVVTREMICPDGNCQKLVNADNKKIQEKQITAKLRSVQRMFARKAEMDAKRLAKLVNN